MFVCYSDMENRIMFLSLWGGKIKIEIKNSHILLDSS